MKKKILMAVMPLCVVMAMTACGGNEDTKEAAETAVTEESAEVDAQAETEAGSFTADKENVESGQTGEESVEEEDVEVVEETEFLPLQLEFEEDAVTQDKSAEYGVYSNSCEDVYQFLNEDGSCPWDYDYEQKEHTEYSGRFAYPVPVQGDFFKTAVVWLRTDADEFMVVTTDGDDNNYGISFHTGNSTWQWNMDEYKKEQEEGDEYFSSGTRSMPFTVTVDDNVADVIFFHSENEGYLGEVTADTEGNVFDADGNPVEPFMIEIRNNYYYTLGGFTVDIAAGERELTQEELQMFVDNIKLLDGMESNETAVTQ